MLGWCVVLAVFALLCDVYLHVVLVYVHVSMDQNVESAFSDFNVI